MTADYIDLPSHVATVDGFVRALHRKALTAGSDFADVATSAGSLHTVLKRLRIEADDTNTVLNRPSSTNGTGQDGRQARQVASTLANCQATVRRLDAVLKCVEGQEGNDGRGIRKLSRREGVAIAAMVDDMIARRASLENMLDDVQAISRAKTRRDLGAQEDSDIRDVEKAMEQGDAAADHSPRKGPLPVDETGDDLCQDNDSKHNQAGFPGEMLENDTEVILSDGTASNPFSIPGEREGRPQLSELGVHQSPRSIYHSQSPSAQDYDSRQTYQDALDFDFSEPETSPMALVSTTDIMDSDRFVTERLATRLASMHLAPGLASPTYVESLGAPLGAPPGSQNLAHTREEKQLAMSVPIQQPGNWSRHAVPVRSILSHGLSDARSFSPPTSPYGSCPRQALLDAFPSSMLGESSLARPRPRFSKLAPDSYGQEIPLDAKWTRIKRTLVSPEVLERARVRYEARPDFVAVLGVLTRDEIADFARQSVQVRTARQHEPMATSKPSREPVRQRAAGYVEREMATSHRSQVGIHDDTDSELWDESDMTEDADEQPGRIRSPYDRGRHVPRKYAEKERDGSSYPFIVSPPASVHGDHVPPASTAKPKSILKNRKTNRVRFYQDGSPHLSRRHRSRNRSTGRRGDRHQDWHQDRERERSRDDGRRRRDRDQDYGSVRESHGRDRCRDRERDRDERPKKSTLGETLGAVGIGSAAASLMGVLAEAATHL